MRLIAKKNVVSRNSLSRMVTRLWPFMLAIRLPLTFGNVNRPLTITMLAITEVKASLTIDISRGAVNCNFICNIVRACATLYEYVTLTQLESVKLFKVVCAHCTSDVFMTTLIDIVGNINVDTVELGVF